MGEFIDLINLWSSQILIQSLFNEETFAWDHSLSGTNVLRLLAIVSFNVDPFVAAVEDPRELSIFFPFSSAST
jgi:hypothetical protein